MSLAKRQLEQQEAMERAAEELALVTKNLVRCDTCDDVTDNFGDRSEAYALGNWNITQGTDLGQVFEGDRVAMTTAVDAVIDGAPTECHCDRVLNSD